MNGVSVSPAQKSQNAPTWQVENTASDRPFSVVSRWVSALSRPSSTYYNKV